MYVYVVYRDNLLYGVYNDGHEAEKRRNFISTELSYQGYTDTRVYVTAMKVQ